MTYIIVYLLIGIMAAIILSASIRNGLKKAKAQGIFQVIQLILIFIILWPVMIINVIRNLFKK
jgi:hypothetical protein